MMQTARRPKIREVIADRIRSFIASENLKAGDRLPTETELAERFGVSRLSLREATKALEFLGVLEARPGRGLTVSLFSMDRLIGYLGFHPELQEAPLESLIDTRVILETSVLAMVAKKMKSKPEIYESLNTINGELKRAQDLQTWLDLDLTFHRQLIEAGGLRPIVAFSGVIELFFDRFHKSMKQAEWKQGIVSHQKIIDCLNRGETSKARDELKKHIESHKQRLGVHS